jgi:hypothetical protein
LTAIGIPYAISSSTTEAETMALKALVEPRKMHPKMTTSAKFRYKEFRGTFSLGCTLLKKREAGRPPSLAKAKIIRLLVVMMEIVAKSMQTRGNLEIIRNEP